MKITKANLSTEYPKLKVKLPDALGQEQFEKTVDTYLPLYDKSEVIKKRVDTFVLKLNEAIAKEQPKTKVKRVAKQPKDKTKEGAKTQKKQAKQPASSKKEKKTGQKVESFTEDERLIRRFYKAIGKESQRRTILYIYRDIEKRITERKVSRTSPLAKLVEEVSQRLKKVLDAMSKSGLTHVTITMDKSSADFFKKVKAIANDKTIRASVSLLKRFTGIEGEIEPDKAKVKRLFNAFNKAFKTDKICQDDLYYQEAKEATAALDAYLKGKTNEIAISPTSLKGVNGLGKSKTTPKKRRAGRLGSGKTTRKKQQQLNGIEPKPAPVSAPQPEPVVVNRFQVDLTPPAPVQPVNNPVPVKEKVGGDLNGLFTPITAQAPESEHEKITLPGDLGKFLGYVERYEYSILLRGEKGAGKTRMMYQMMNTFAKANFTVGCFSLEIGKHSNIVKDMRNEYLCPTIVNKVQIAESTPNGLDDIRAAAKHFDVVAIDSWGKIPGVKSDDFDKLRKEFPKTMFIVIFQSTTNGTARGGSMPEYDAGIVIQVAEGGKAYCEKNRYSGEELTYLVFERRLESQPAA